MKTAPIQLKKIVFATGVVSALLFSTIMPVVASAAEVSAPATAQSVQLLPPNVGNTCDQLPTPVFKAYVYNNAVNSFDVTIADASYVAIAGSVGEEQIPFNFMTRFVDSSGILHMHVDTQTIQVSGSVPVTLTLLSVRADKTVCASTVSAVLVGSVSSTPSDTVEGNGGYVPSHVKQPEPTPSKPSDIDSQIPDTDNTGGTVAANLGVQGTLSKVCATAGGATRLWTVLLAIYLLIVAATILAQPTSKTSEQSSVLMSAAITLPFLALFAIWIAAPACRIGFWAPIAALAIAVAGFMLGFRHSQPAKSSASSAQLPKSTATPSTKPLITPPPKSPPPPVVPKNDKDK